MVVYNGSRVVAGNIPHYYSKRMSGLLSLLQLVLEQATAGKKPQRRKRGQQAQGEAPKRDVRAASSVELTGDLWTDLLRTMSYDNVLHDHHYKNSTENHEISNQKQFMCHIVLLVVV